MFQFCEHRRVGDTAPQRKTLVSCYLLRVSTPPRDQVTPDPRGGESDEKPFVRPTIHDVARIANVSSTTVSHALSSKRRVSAETAERIRAAIAYLGYVPNSRAQNLQSGRAFMIGLVVPDVSVPFFGELAAEVERASDALGYGTVISSSRKVMSGEARFASLLKSRAVDGVIYVAGGEGGDAEVTRLLGSYPIVLADEFIVGLEGFPLVAADQRAGGVLAGEHLFGLGHRRVAVIEGPPELRSSQERLAGFLQVFPEATVVSGNFTEEVAYHRTASCWNSAIRRLPSSPRTTTLRSGRSRVRGTEVSRSRRISPSSVSMTSLSPAASSPP
jgi:LacI family transcriptional regulator